MSEEQSPVGAGNVSPNLASRTFGRWLESKSASNMLIIGLLLLAAIPIIGVGLATTRTIMPYDWKQIIPTLPASAPSSTQITALFTCAKGKSVTAVFDGPSVDLSLSDGRHLTLPQARSADGARYANPDESFVFWNVGDTAFIQENGVETYSKCVTNG